MSSEIWNRAERMSWYKRAMQPASWGAVHSAMGRSSATIPILSNRSAMSRIAKARLLEPVINFEERHVLPECSKPA